MAPIRLLDNPIIANSEFHQPREPSCEPFRLDEHEIVAEPMDLFQDARGDRPVEAFKIERPQLMFVPIEDKMVVDVHMELAADKQ